MILLSGTVLSSGGLTCFIASFWYTSHSMNESGDAGHPAFLVLEHEHKNVQECWSMGPGLLLAWSASVLTMIGAFFILCGGGTTPVIREYKILKN